MSRIDLGTNIKEPKTVPATVEGFWKAVDDPETGRICAELADILEATRRGELDIKEYKTLKNDKKSGCLYYTPHAHFAKGYKSGDSEPVDSGKAVVDLDGCEHFPELYAEKLMGRERELGINMVNRSVSGTGGHILFDIPEGLTRQEAQKWLATEILGGVKYDEAVHDEARAIYIPCREYILYIDEELMFSDELHPAKGVAQIRNEECNKRTVPLLHYPEDYHGIPFERILAKYWELNNHGFEPTEGDRDTLTFQLASDLRHICGKSFEWLDQVIPCYDGFPLEEKRQKIKNALASKYEGMPTRLRDVLEALQDNGQAKPPAEGSDGASATVTLAINANQLPVGLKESLKPYPQNMWPPLVVGMMPALMALADRVTYRYCDGKTGYLGGMAIILGEQASNKSAIEEAVERWLVDLRREDEVVKEREDRVRDANKRRKANERAQEAPAGVVRVVPITISCSKLLKRLKQSQGHCLYSICTEAETLLKSNGSGTWAQKWDIYRNAFGREMWGVDFNSDQSESGDVKVAYSWTILGTPRTVMKMFSGRNESNAENGLSSRMMLSEMPDTMFAKITVFKELTDNDMQRISQATELLRSASGFYDTPRLRKAIDKWLEEKRVESARNMDVVMDRFRRRAGVIGFRCGVVFMLLAGKESNACIDFALKMADYTLQMQLRTFGPLLAKHYADNSSDANGTINGNIFEQLPSPFSLQDLRRLKGREFSDGTIYSIISRWKSEGWVEKNGKSWVKKR